MQQNGTAQHLTNDLVAARHIQMRRCQRLCWLQDPFGKFRKCFQWNDEMKKRDCQSQKSMMCDCVANSSVPSTPECAEWDQKFEVGLAGCTSPKMHSWLVAGMGRMPSSHAPTIQISSTAPFQMHEKRSYGRSQEMLLLFFSNGYCQFREAEEHDVRLCGSDKCSGLSRMRRMGQDL